MTQQPTILTRGQTSRALRAFIAASGIWGAWGQAVGIGTAVFTGFALQLGADGSFVALFTSIAYFAALAQLVSPLLAARVQHKKRLIITAGFFEILCRGLAVAIPFVFAPHLQLGALVALISAGLLFGHLISPIYSTWMANTIPEGIRARFTSRQTIVSTLVAMVFGFLIGRFVDMFPAAGKLQAFVWVFGIGSLFGWLGYVILGRAPFPAATPSEAAGLCLRDMLQPFRSASFRRAVLFYGLWTFATGVSGPLYSVFMIDRLHISYTGISVFNALFMVTSIGAYRIWAGLIDRFGSKPVLQILLVPAALVPLVWVLNKPEAYYLVPVALVLSGILFPGIGVGVTPLLYSLLPVGERRTLYLAAWAVSVNLLGAVGPLAGSFLARAMEGVEYAFAGFPVGNLQLTFAVSAAASVAPILVLRGLRDVKGISPRLLLQQIFRGNVLSYAYNTMVYHTATAEERRARAAFALGRSGNPMAIEQLIQALSDASYKVRSAAARALGETHSEEATGSLIRELLDGESDIRSEAAEALGRLGHAGGVDPLVDALSDADPRVRISAIRGLANIDSDEVRELVFWHFSSDFDPRTFPTLVDVLGEAGDTRVVKPALEHLGDFHSQAIRLQLLDSVCQALGARNQFYRLLSHDDQRRAAEISRMLKRAGSRLCKSPNLDVNSRHELQRPSQRLVQAYEDENTEWVIESVRQIVGIVRDGLSAQGRPAYEVLSVFIVILAINTFLLNPAREEMPVAQEIFLAVCLTRLADLVRQIEG
ncbi:MAG: MFS transporter [Candidatus Latescibacterota bacterium]